MCSVQCVAKVCGDKCSVCEHISLIHDSMTTAVHINVSDDSSLLTTVYCQAVFNNFYSDIN